MRVVSWFKSVRLAVVLILLLAASSVVGTFYPQGLPPEEGREIYGDAGYRVLDFLGVFDLYHSTWFLFLVFLLALNILVCSLSRVRRTWRLVTWADAGPDGRPAGLTVLRTVRTILPPAEALARVQDAFRREGLRPRPGPEGELRLDRGRLGRLGPELSHLGFLVIIAGMILGSITGFRGTIYLAEGESGDSVELGPRETVRLPFEVRCDEFEVEYYAGTRRPKEYTSWLTVIEDGTDRFQRKVEVNHPLRHRGYWLYQSTWGQTAPAAGDEWVRLRLRPGTAEIGLGLGERRAIAGTNMEVELLRFEPDFVMEADGRVTSRSNELRNPAAEVRITRGGEPLEEEWVFADFPGVHSTGDETVPALDLVEFNYREYTGLQVAHDPGVPCVWVGCGLLLTGLFLSFTVAHRRAWVRVGPDGQGSALHVGLGARGGLGAFADSVGARLDAAGLGFGPGGKEGA